MPNKGYITAGADDVIAKYAAKQEVLNLCGLYVTNVNGGEGVSDLPAWKLKRGIVNATHMLKAKQTADRLRAKLEARRATAAAAAADLD